MIAQNQGSKFIVHVSVDFTYALVVLVSVHDTQVSQIFVLDSLTMVAYAHVERNLMIKVAFIIWRYAIVPKKSNLVLAEILGELQALSTEDTTLPSLHWLTIISAVLTYVFAPSSSSTRTSRRTGLTKCVRFRPLFEQLVFAIIAGGNQCCIPSVILSVDVCLLNETQQ